MVNFACKKFNVEEIVKCSFGLSKSEYGILKFLLSNDNKRFTTEEISRELKLDKSTIQRSIKRLHGKGLVIRGQKNQSRGGYLFFYLVKDKKIIRQMMLDVIDNWSLGVKKELINW